MSVNVDWDDAVQEPVFLNAGPEEVFGFVHAPRRADRSDIGVVICPPFGWEEMCSHRGRRAWAQALAGSGFATIRIDLPSAGESPGLPEDPDRVEAWKTAIAGAASWLRETMGSRRVLALGIGLGGLLACAAASEGAPIDDLMLWGVLARGRSMLRELRAYAAIVAARYPEDNVQPPPEGVLEVTGFVMTSETTDAIEPIDLTKLTLSDPQQRRILLIDRDELGVDKRLLEHLEGLGADVTVMPAKDYGDLMAQPQDIRGPARTIEASVAWLRGLAPAAPSEVTVTMATSVSDSAAVTDEVTERAIALPSPSGHSYVVIAESAAGDREPVTAVLLNAGALRRIGPNRTWVEASRRWAARGVTSVRADFEGMGDSDGDERVLVDSGSLYSERMTERTVWLMDQLSELGLPPRFVLVGLCSGAYWAIRGAVADPRVVGSFTINLYAFHWSRELVAERDRAETVAALRGGLLRRAMRGGITPYHIRRALRSIRGASLGGDSVERRQTPVVTDELNTLRDRGTEVLISLSQGEPLYDQFEREGRVAQMGDWPNVSLERLPGTDHMARALWIQTILHQQMDAGLDRILASQAPSSVSREPPVGELLG